MRDSAQALFALRQLVNQLSRLSLLDVALREACIFAAARGYLLRLDLPPQYSPGVCAGRQPRAETTVLPPARPEGGNCRPNPNAPRRGAARGLHLRGRARVEREFFIDNLLVRIHVILEMFWWIGLAPWEFELPFPGSRLSTFLVLSLLLLSRLSLLDAALREACIFAAARG